MAGKPRARRTQVLTFIAAMAGKPRARRTQVLTFIAAMAGKPRARRTQVLTFIAAMAGKPRASGPWWLESHVLCRPRSSMAGKPLGIHSVSTRSMRPGHEEARWFSKMAPYGVIYCWAFCEGMLQQVQRCRNIGRAGSNIPLCPKRAWNRPLEACGTNGPRVWALIGSLV